MRGRHQSRSITLAYGAVSLALLIVIAAVALVVQPPAPPALAEFAPQAEKTIDQAPDQQSSQFGKSGTGACAAGQQDCVAGGSGAGLGSGVTTTTASPPANEPRTVIDKRRVRRCVGDPPRQIEDPQSPPCVNYFEGNNGGATTRGVTRDEIRVAFTANGWEYVKQLLPALETFFNRRFEFYGRKIHLVDGGGFQFSPESMRATADAIDEKQVFAAIGGLSNGVGVRPFTTQLARHKIIAVRPIDWQTEGDAAALHPYLWFYQPTFDVLAGNLGEFACRSLVGRQAEYAGGSERAKARSFAVLEPVFNESAAGGRPDVGVIADALRACGPPVRVAEYHPRSGDARSTANNADERALLADLQASGVTTIVALGPSGATAELMQQASGTYQPEWLLPADNPNQLAELSYQSAPTDQTLHLMAMGGFNKGVPITDRPSTWALQEAGSSPPDDRANVVEETQQMYQTLLLLSSGIQAAGPNLTPETFAAALQKLKFPNPGAGAEPYFQASVGFAGDHSMIDDESVQWWSSTAPAYGLRSSDTGGWCSVDQGKRWRRGLWPKDQKLFTPSPTGQCP